MPVRAGSIACVMLLFAMRAVAAAGLPHLNIIPGSLTVSGISSGGYMATQYQVAFSQDVAGAGIIAAGPWFCARGVITRALDECLEGEPAGPEIQPLVAAARAGAAAKLIDDTSWLATDRVWILHGAKDRVIGAAVADSLNRFYRAFMPPDRIRYETELAAGHGFPTENYGGACDASEPPWINDCDYDAAGRMLQYLYGELRAPAADQGGKLLTFDQDRYATGGMLTSFKDEGFVFVPKDCATGALCRVHVVFHGCRQGSGFIGRAFAKNAGYNRWADANRIVVLYPQVAASWVWPFNPQGCWDWWGYSGPGYTSRIGLQIAAVNRMLRALGAGS